MVTDQQKHELVRKYLRDFHESFTPASNYALLRDCTRVLGRSDGDTELCDELADIAHSREFRQEYRNMARAQAVPAAPAKPAPKVNAKAAPQEAKQAPPPREPKVPSTAKIVWLVKENPKRVGSASHARFDGYFGTKTVAAFLEAGGTRADIANDVGKGYFEVVE